MRVFNFIAIAVVLMKFSNVSLAHFLIFFMGKWKEVVKNCIFYTKSRAGSRKRRFIIGGDAHEFPCQSTCFLPK